MIKIDEGKKKAGKFALVEKEVGEKTFLDIDLLVGSHLFLIMKCGFFLEYFQSACERKAKKVQGECAIFIYLFSPNGIEVKEML